MEVVALQQKNAVEKYNAGIYCKSLVPPILEHGVAICDTTTPDKIQKRADAW